MKSLHLLVNALGVGSPLPTPTSIPLKLSQPIKPSSTRCCVCFLKLSIVPVKINITLYYNSNPLDDLYENLEEDYINSVISNLTSIISAYAYIEIAQNPPQPENISDYNHEPIDLIGSLNNIKRKDVKFYDFYREMREILGTVRDLHFRIFGLNTPKGIKLD